MIKSTDEIFFELSNKESESVNILLTLKIILLIYIQASFILSPILCDIYLILA